MSRNQELTREWTFACDSLGFQLMEDTIGNRGLRDFGMMWTALAPQVTPSHHNWMAGKFEGRDVLVSYYFQDGGSSSDTHETRVFVRVDPPLFLGLEVARRVFLSPAPKLQFDAGFDDRFAVRSYLPERALGLLWPGREPLLAAMLSENVALGYHPELVDSFASIHVDRFLSNPHALTEMLRRASSLALAMEQRRAILGDTADEQLERSEWAYFAEAERLTFDPKRRLIHGKFRDHDIFFSQKTIPDRAFSLVQVGFPTHTGIDLTITLETALSRFGNMIGFSDLEIGDAAFDREFRIKAEPIHVVEGPVRALLATQAARDAVATLVRKYWQFRLHDRFAFVSVRPARAGGEIRVVLDELAAFIEAASAQHSSPPSRGPYRR